MKADEHDKPNRADALSGADYAESLPAVAKGSGLFQAICAIDASIDAAMSFAMVVDLMGFGLRSLDSEYSAATLAVAEMLQRHLRDAKARCDAIFGEDAPLPPVTSLRTGDHSPGAGP